MKSYIVVTEKCQLIQAETPEEAGGVALCGGELGEQARKEADKMWFARPIANYGGPGMSGDARGWAVILSGVSPSNSRAALVFRI